MKIKKILGGWGVGSRGEGGGAGGHRVGEGQG